MKSKSLIAMSIARPASCIHVSRDEWTLEIVKEPRPSCIGKWRIRETLRNMLPHGVEYIEGVFVKRTGHKHHVRYAIADAIMTFDEAVRELESAERRAKANAPKQPAETGELRQLELNLGEAI